MALHLTDCMDFELAWEEEEKRYPPEIFAQFPIDRETFVHRGKALPSIGFADDGRSIGGSFYDGKQVHLFVIADYHGKWGTLIGAWVDWTFSWADSMELRVEIENQACRRFITKLNARYLNDEGIYAVYLFSKENLPRRFQNRRPLPLMQAA